MEELIALWAIGLVGFAYEHVCFLLVEAFQMSCCESIIMIILICFALSGMMAYLGRVAWRFLWG